MTAEPGQSRPGTPAARCQPFAPAFPSLYWAATHRLSGAQDGACVALTPRGAAQEGAAAHRLPAPALPLPAAPCPGHGPRRHQPEGARRTCFCMFFIWGSFCFVEDERKRQILHRYFL